MRISKGVLVGVLSLIVGCGLQSKSADEAFSDISVNTNNPNQLTGNSPTVQNFCEGYWGITALLVTFVGKNGAEVPESLEDASWIGYGDETYATLDDPGDCPPHLKPVI